VLEGEAMAGISTHPGFAFIVAIGIAAAGCGGPQQASTALPGDAAAQRAWRPLSRYAPSGQPLLYVGDDSNGTIDIFPLTGPNQKQIGSISKGIKDPWGLSVDGSGALYVANARNGTVRVYPYGSSSPSMTYSGGVDEPLYAVTDSAGHVFVSGRDPGPHNLGYVYEYKAGTNVPIAHARLGSEADGMAEDAQGNLYVAFRRTGPNCSIAEFGPRLRNERLLGMTISQPQGLLVDGTANIVVVESTAERIDVFPPGATIPSVTVTVSGIGSLAQLAMQNSETTLWVSSEAGFVYSMPYPLTPSTLPTEYEQDAVLSNGIAVTR
jgi:hypothetical protein